MRTLTILTFAAFIAVPTFVAAQSMTAQQYHKEKGPCACPEDKDNEETNAEGGVPSVRATASKLRIVI
jgi:hypothetical protein